MAKKTEMNNVDAEISSISVVFKALSVLDKESAQRVLDYVAKKLGLTSNTQFEAEAREEVKNVEREAVGDAESIKDSHNDQDDSYGISSVALRWMKRNGLSTEQLSTLFSIGGDEIDLVAEKVSGKNKKDKMHSVILLKGIAAYLSTGAARATHEQIKEACLHYDAFDSANFASYLKSFAAEVSGTKESGYTLTARGLAKATEMIKAATASGS